MENLNIPLKGKLNIPKDKLEPLGKEFIIKEAYCQNGHSLMSEVRINDLKELT